MYEMPLLLTTLPAMEEWSGSSLHGSGASIKEAERSGDRNDPRYVRPFALLSMIERYIRRLELQYAIPPILAYFPQNDNAWRERPEVPAD